MKIKDTRSSIGTAVKYVLLVLGAILLMFPFVWMLLTSVKTLSEAVHIPPQWLPAVPQWNNYVHAWSLAPFALYFRNSIWIGALTVAGTLLLSILGAYAFTIYHFPCKGLLLTLFMLTMMVPNELLIIQNYVTISDLGLLDTFAGIILPTLADGFYIYMLTEYFRQTPPSLFKAAKVDGCSDWRYLWRVMVPLNKNAIATVGILSFITSWNAFLWPMMVTQSDAHRTVSVGLVLFKNTASSNVQYQMAAACMVLLPMVVVYIIFRKKIIAGVASGGIKG